MAESWSGASSAIESALRAPTISPDRSSARNASGVHQLDLERGAGRALQGRDQGGGVDRGAGLATLGAAQRDREGALEDLREQLEPLRLPGAVLDGDRRRLGVEVHLGRRDRRRRAGRAVGRERVEGQVELVDRAQLAGWDPDVEVEGRLVAEDGRADQGAVRADVEPGAAALGERGVRALEVEVHRGDRDAEGVLPQLELLGRRAVAGQGDRVDAQVVEGAGACGAAGLGLQGRVLRVGAGQAERVGRESARGIDERSPVPVRVSSGMPARGRHGGGDLARSPSTSATTRWLAVAVSAGGTLRAQLDRGVVVVPVGERGHGGEAGGDQCRRRRLRG